MTHPADGRQGFGGGMFFSRKTYDYNNGLSTAFRQWRADSHCKYIHGYAFKIELVFAAFNLDATNWVVDFGSMKSLKAMFEDTFDHKTLVATDDPHIEWFREGKRLGTMDLIEVDATGCERMAYMIYEVAEQWLKDAGYGERVIMWEVNVHEHSGNSGGFTRAQMESLLHQASSGNDFRDIDPGFAVPSNPINHLRAEVKTVNDMVDETFDSIRQGARRAPKSFKP